MNLAFAGTTKERVEEVKMKKKKQKTQQHYRSDVLISIHDPSNCNVKKKKKNL